MESPIPNPIIPGFSPDPSICLIGDTFFLVNSSFHVFPCLPIYASKDLVSWKHIGHAINRRSQLSLERATTILHPGDDGNTVIATGGLYAPTIRHHKGTTYILCTNVIHESSDNPGGAPNFIIHTTDINSGNWSDPIYYDWEGIDPSIFFDDDGKVYVQGNTSGDFGIFNMEIDLHSGKFLQQPQMIWKREKNVWSEGAHIYKKDGWYYLLCAEGGTFTYHKLVMSRSKSIWGPYEECPRNPIWTAHGTSNYVQHTGHADLFQDMQSNWWAVMLGVRMADGRYSMGRETFLTPVEWPEGQWPVVQPVKADREQGKIGHGVSCAFDGVDWLYLRDPDLDRYEVQDGDARLKASAVELTSPDKTVTFIGKRQRMLNGTATVTLSLSGLDEQAIRAGLVMYKDELRFLSVGYDFGKQHVFFHGINTVRGLIQDVKRDVHQLDNLMFQISYTEQTYRLSFKSVPEDSWVLLGEVDTLEMCGFDFTGPLVGMFAVGPDVDVHFKDFIIDDKN